jgi:hypothetical protein
MSVEAAPRRIFLTQEKTLDLLGPLRTYLRWAYYLGKSHGLQLVCIWSRYVLSGGFPLRISYGPEPRFVIPRQWNVPFGVLYGCVATILTLMAV